MTSWQVDGPQRLSLDGELTQLDVWLMHGKLRVVRTDGPARIEVRKVGRRGVAVTHEDGVLSVQHEPRKRHWAGPFWWFTMGRGRFTADIAIAVPTTAVGDLTLVSGSIVVSGLRRGATVDVTSGSITLMGLDGTVRAKTVSGAIEAMGVSGDLQLETISGEISLAESSARRVHARTISGAVTCDLDNPHTNEVRLDTTSGEITVRVPEDADLEVRLNATSGRVTSAFSQVRPSGLPGFNSATGRIGSGSGSLNAYAVSGSVALLSRPATEAGSDAEGTSPEHPAHGGTG